MKGISDLDKLGGVKPQSKGGSATSETDSDLFKKTFEKVLAGSEQTGEAVRTPSASTLGEIQSVGLRIDGTDKSSLETGTEALLNKLDNYIRALIDPGKTLKNIEPLLMDVKQEADQLTDAIQSADKGQEDMKSLAEQSTLLARVEYQKFIRGDYV
jgi:hypothetical protein